MKTKIKITTHRKKKDHATRGYRAAVSLSDGRMLVASVSRGPRVGHHFGRDSYSWHATVRHGSVEVWSGQVRHNASVKSIVQRWLAGEALGIAP